MDMKPWRSVSVLAAIWLGVGLGACASQDRDGAAPRQTTAQETRADLTMDDLAGEWRFDAASVEAAIVEQVQAGLDDIDDPAQREQFRSSMEAMTKPAIDMLTSVSLTLEPDGSLRSSSVDLDGTREQLDGSWALDGGIVTFVVRQPDLYDEDVSAALVIDAKTMEMRMDDSGDPPMILLLRKRS